MWVRLSSLFTKAQLLANISPLFVQLFQVCRNGVLPASLLTVTIRRLHETDHVYDGKAVIDHFSLDISNYIRIIAAQFRDLQKDQDKFSACMKKAFLQNVYLHVNMDMSLMQGFQKATSLSHHLHVLRCLWRAVVLPGSSHMLGCLFSLHVTAVLSRTRVLLTAVS